MAENTIKLKNTNTGKVSELTETVYQNLKKLNAISNDYVVDIPTKEFKEKIENEIKETSEKTSSISNNQKK